MREAVLGGMNTAPVLFFGKFAQAQRPTKSIIHNKKESRQTSEKESGVRNAELTAYATARMMRANMLRC
jgi:hypothetical protein